MSIKGTRNDEAVLCTLDKTYMLRLAESSNVMLLAPTTEKKRKQREEQEEPASEADADAGQESEKLEVQASVSAHFEIIRCAPKTGGLAALLSARPYTGANDSESTASLDTAAAAASADAHLPLQRRLTLEELEVTVQASSAELRTALREARALSVDGCWCVLEPQLESDILEAALSLCVEHEWPVNAVPVAQCVELCVAQFPGFDELSVRHCLRTHSTQAVGADATWESWLEAANLGALALDASAIARFRARTLLAMCDVWPRDKFLEAWAEALPSGTMPDESLLAGLAILLPPVPDPMNPDEEPVPMLQSLPLASLSLVPKERFAQLFKVKRAWRLEELAPYVKDLVDPTTAPTKLVLQFSRSVTANDGSVSYVSR